MKRPLGQHGVFFAAVLSSLPLSLLANETTTPEAWVKLAVEELCSPEQPVPGIEAERALPGAWFIDENRQENEGVIGWLDQRFALPGGDELRLIRSQPGGQLRRMTVEFSAFDRDITRPKLQAMTDGTCRLLVGRRIVETTSGETLLEQLDSDLQTVRWTEMLEAPWPPGQDLGGPRIALIDSGLAYDLPIYRDRLARNTRGEPLGYDFWDDDPLPYDGDTSRGAFLPIRHGSAVASILVREAPSAALVPFRYPRPEMARMGEVVEHAAKAGAAIVAMPLGSRRPSDWTAFANAMRKHSEILAIVSAGNDGEDIDRSPIWPAVLKLDNIITVTSSDGFGRLAPRANWGKTSVDIMLPAENLDVIDFRGATGKASGSSYAVPRLAALAARLLQADPSLQISSLRAEIFARAVPSPYEDDVVAIGWIPDPLSD